MMGFFSKLFGKSSKSSISEVDFEGMLPVLADARQVPVEYLNSVYKELTVGVTPLSPKAAYAYTDLLFSRMYLKCLTKFVELLEARQELVEIVALTKHYIDEYCIDSAAAFLDKVIANTVEPFIVVLLTLSKAKVLLLSADLDNFRRSLQLHDELIQAFQQNDMPELVDSLVSSRTETLGHLVSLYPNKQNIQEYLEAAHQELAKCRPDSGSSESSREVVLSQMKITLYVSGLRLADPEILDEVTKIDEELLEIYNMQNDTPDNLFYHQYTSTRLAGIVGMLRYDLNKVEGVISLLEDLKPGAIDGVSAENIESLEKTKQDFSEKIDRMREGKSIQVIEGAWLNKTISCTTGVSSSQKVF